MIVTGARRNAPAPAPPSPGEQTAAPAVPLPLQPPLEELIQSACVIYALVG